MLWYWSPGRRLSTLSSKWAEPHCQVRKASPEVPHQPSLGRGESRIDVGLSAPCKAVIQFLFCPTQHGRLYRYRALARAVILLTDVGTSPFSPAPAHLSSVTSLLWPSQTVLCHPPLLSPIHFPLTGIFLLPLLHSRHFFWLTPSHT